MSILKSPPCRESNRVSLPAQRLAKRREFLPLSLVILIKTVIGHTNGKLIVFGPEAKRHGN